MKINESIITFCGQKAKVNCDRNCSKAWGINNRPRDKKGNFLPDKSLGMAPKDPGTYEYDVGKPLSPDEFPQKWCVRECERCNMSSPGKYSQSLPLNYEQLLKDFIS